MRPAVRNIIIIAVIVLVSILFISYVASRGNDSEDDNAAQEESRIDLSEYADSDTQASLTTRGKVTADEEFRQIRLTVSPSERKLQVTSGYQETLEREEVFPNNQAAYREFILALKAAGFSERNPKSTQDEPEGACALGKRYYYELSEFTDPVVSTWSTSCSVKNQTFAGNGQSVRRLFQLQIPDYNRYTRSVRL